MKYKEKNFNNFLAMDDIKNALKTLRDKKCESTEILNAILYYFELHGITYSSINDLRKYCDKCKNYDQDDWEWFLRYFMSSISGHLQNPFIEDWSRFDLDSLLNKRMES